MNTDEVPARGSRANVESSGADPVALCILGHVLGARKQKRVERERANARAAEHAAIRASVEGHIDEDGGLTTEGIAALRAYLRKAGYIVDNTVEGSRLPADVHAAWVLGLARIGDFMAFDGNAMLPPGEPARFVAGADLLKEAAIREYRGGSQGVSVPLGHGVRWRTSAIRGQLVTVGHRWETVDKGQLTVTDRRIIFTGPRKTVEFQFSKLASMSMFSDAVALGVTNRQATSTFLLKQPAVFAQMVRASLEAGREPLERPQLEDAGDSPASPARELPRGADGAHSTRQVSPPALSKASSRDESNWW